jgi:membrane protein CcdC involved in cytochrome C biogenesis
MCKVLKIVVCSFFAIVLFVLRFTDSDYPFGIFKLFVMPISYISFFFSFIYSFYVCLRIAVSNTYCVLFVFVLCTLCCPSLWIVPSVFSNVYFHDKVTCYVTYLFTRSLVLCVRFAIVLFVLRFTDSDYPFGIFKLFVMPISYISFFFSFIYSFYCLFQNSNYCIRNTIYVLVCTCMQWWENGWNIFKQFSDHFQSYAVINEAWHHM